MSDDKTEEPTEAKKREARLKGQVVKSQELTAAATLAVSFALIAGVLPKLGEMMIQMLQVSFVSIGKVGDPLNSLRQMLGSILQIMATALLPAMIGAVAVGLLINLLTSGVGFSPQSIQPDLNKLNPMNALGRWFSKKTAMDAVKHIFKTGVMVWIVWGYWREEYSSYITVSRMAIGQMADRFQSILGLAWKLVELQVVFGAVDFGLQYYEHRQSMKMTKQEVKDEYKKQEGDPMMKAQRRARARRMIKSAGMNRLPEASVVITNPTHLAIALKFNMTMPAPIVVSKGADIVALEIRRRAKELGIPIVEDKPLARALFPLDLEQTIPPEFFQAVAELLLSVRDAEEYL